MKVPSLLPEQTGLSPGLRCWLLPIFPRRLQRSIVGTTELNFRVRNGNGWTLCVIKTNCFLPRSSKIEQQNLSQNPELVMRRVRITVLHRKEVIQPHLPIRLPCYDLTPIIEPTFDCCLLAVSSQASGVPNFHGLTGGVYKARERIHRGMLIRDY